jgi:hypothetical protein
MLKNVTNIQSNLSSSILQLVPSRHKSLRYTQAGGLIQWLVTSNGTTKSDCPELDVELNVIFRWDHEQGEDSIVVEETPTSQSKTP